MEPQKDHRKGKKSRLYLSASRKSKSKLAKKRSRRRWSQTNNGLAKAGGTEPPTPATSGIIEGKALHHDKVMAHLGGEDVHPALTTAKREAQRDQKIGISDDESIKNTPPLDYATNYASIPQIAGTSKQPDEPTPVFIEPEPVATASTSSYDPFATTPDYLEVPIAMPNPIDTSTIAIKQEVDIEYNNLEPVFNSGVLVKSVKTQTDQNYYDIKIHGLEVQLRESERKRKKLERDLKELRSRINDSQLKENLTRITLTELNF